MNTSINADKTGKKIGHRFTAGISGNPAGRPKASGVDKIAKFKETIDKNINSVFYKVLDSALNGNVEAARLIFDAYGLHDRLTDKEAA